MYFSGEQEMAVIRRLYGLRRTAVLTGPAALRVMGIKTLDWVTDIDLALAGETRAKAKGRWRPGFVYHSGRLEPGHIVVYRGVTMTSLIMALFDTYRYHGRLPALVSMESALRRPEVSKDLLRRWAEELPQSPGVRGFRQLIEYASERSESPFETLGRDRVLGANLPGVVSVEQQVPFQYRDSWGQPRNGRADLEINGCIVVEFDGRSKSRDDWEEVTREERARERWLMKGQKVLIRAEWADLKSGALVAMVKAALKLTGFT
ncbi:hypothetical protein [Corynebacterium senegalense]|uniref:hypothetical protein n=1 Tax=Corynebacterium senegalense TaxID=2080750 RepID=UPI000E20AE07|nr:hypothetical protein [Corynebacterium senegalense]